MREMLAPTAALGRNGFKGIIGTGYTMDGFLVVLWGQLVLERVSPEAMVGGPSCDGGGR